MFLLDEIKKNIEQYSDLVDLRIKELSLPEEEKTLKTNAFMRQEKEVNEKGVELRKRAGIFAVSEAMLCRECGKVFPILAGKQGTQVAYSDCLKHTNKQALEG